MDTLAPGPVKVVGPPALVGAAGNPPVAGCTTGCTPANEIGGSVAVTVVGTSRGTGTSLAAACSVPSILISGTGAWSCSAWTGTAITAGKFVDGDFVLSATQSDASGNPQPTPTTANFSVKTRPPGAPLISVPTDGAFTRNPSPLLQITAAEAGGSVIVSLLNQASSIVATCGPQPVSAARTATCPVASALVDGTYTLSAVHTDAAGNVSVPGVSTLHVKTRTATPVFVSTLAGGTLPDPIRLEGAAEANATVVVKIDDDPALEAVTADANGRFSVPAGVISTGSHFAQAVATDFVGNTAQSTRVQFNVSLGGQVAGSSFGCSSAGGSGTWAALLLLGIVPLLGRRRKGVALAVAVVAGAGAARADGTDLGLDSFRPASGGDGTIGVEGARPPGDGDASWEARGCGRRGGRGRGRSSAAA